MTNSKNPIEYFYSSEKNIKEEDINKFKEYENDLIKFATDYNFSKKSKNKFELYEYQKNILEMWSNNNSSILKKSRQMFSSQTLAIYCAWNLLFNPGFKIGYVSPNNSMSLEFTNKLNHILSLFNIIFDINKDKLKHTSKYEIRLVNGSVLRVSSTKGYELDLIIFDEVDFIRDMEAKWNDASIQAKKRIAVSTPDKKMGFLYNKWKDVVSDDSDEVGMSVNWLDNPMQTKDIKLVNNIPTSPWYEKNCMIISCKDSIRTELHAEFVSGVRPIVPSRINFRIDGDTYDKIIDKIDRKNISLSNYIKDLIKKDLG